MWRAEPYALGMLGELVQTMAGKWITHPPARWPNVIKSRLVSVRGCQVGRSGTDADMSWPRHSSTGGYAGDSGARPSCVSQSCMSK